VFLDLDPVVFGLGLRLDGHGAVRYTSRGALIGAALVAVDAVQVACAEYGSVDADMVGDWPIAAVDRKGEP
jgi:hypothetical protein